MPGTVIEADFRTVPPDPPAVPELDLHDGQEVKLLSGETVVVRLWSRAQIDARSRQLAVAVGELAEDVERAGARLRPVFISSWREWRAAVGADLAGGPTLATLERQEEVLTGFRGALRRAVGTMAPAPAAAAGGESKGLPWFVLVPAVGAAGYGIYKGCQWLAGRFFDGVTQAIPNPGSREEARHGEG